MPYRFAKERLDYSDLASGRVFHSRAGHPALPVRLASEVFLRCLASREANHSAGPAVVYDPCCGAAYHLSALGYLHWPSIREVIGSDVDEEAVWLAERNLGLLSVAGMDQRIGEISEMLRRYGKEAHKAALDSAHVLRRRIATLSQAHRLTTRVFQADATDGRALGANLKDTKPDIVLTDVPYGQHSHWRAPDSGRAWTHPLPAMLDALAGVLLPTSIVAVVSDKGQKIVHARYRRLEQFQVGKRRVVLLRPIP